MSLTDTHSPAPLITSPTSTHLAEKQRTRGNSVPVSPMQAGRNSHMAACTRGEEQTSPPPFPKPKAILPLTHQWHWTSHTRNYLVPICSACKTAKKAWLCGSWGHKRARSYYNRERYRGQSTHICFYSTTLLNPSQHGERLPKAFPICTSTSHAQLVGETEEAPEKWWFTRADHR